MAKQWLKVLWVVLSSLFFKEICKNGTRGHGYMFAIAKGKHQNQVRQLQCQEQPIDHIPFTFRDCRVHIFSDNLSRNSCMYKSHNGTETERPSLARGICEFHQSYF